MLRMHEFAHWHIVRCVQAQSYSLHFVNCPFIVLLLYYYCTIVVLLLYYYCTIIVLLLYYYYTIIILLLYYYCTIIILLLYSYFTIIVLLFYYYCTIIVLLSYFCIVMSLSTKEYTDILWDKLCFITQWMDWTFWKAVVLLFSFDATCNRGLKIHMPSIIIFYNISLLQ